MKHLQTISTTYAISSDLPWSGMCTNLGETSSVYSRPSLSEAIQITPSMMRAHRIICRGCCVYGIFRTARWNETTRFVVNFIYEFMLPPVFVYTCHTSSLSSLAGGITLLPHTSQMYMVEFSRGCWYCKRCNFPFHSSWFDHLVEIRFQIALR